MEKYPYAAVLISVNSHDYYYGNTDKVKQLAEDASQKIIDHRVEKVNIHYFQNRENMIGYISDKRVFYESGASSVEFREVK